jgi:putative transposase
VVAKYLSEEHGLAVSRSCQCVGLSRSAYYREPVDWMTRDAAVINALNGLVEEFPRCGFWKYVGVLSNRGYPWNPKRIYRVYRGLGLNQPRRTRRRVPERDPIPLVVPQRPLHVWSADFMSDALYQGGRFRLFNVIDDFNREAVGIEVDTSAALGSPGARLRAIKGRARAAGHTASRQWPRVPGAGVCRLVP